MDLFPQVLTACLPCLEIEQLWRFTADIVQGLQWIHSKNLAHLDIKPANIFLAGGPGHYCAQIGDYGTMEEIGQHANGDGDGRYLAPERLENEELYVAHPSADIFSLGVTVWSMAARKEAEAKDWESLAQDLENKICFFSEDIQDFLRWVLKTDPNERPTANQLLQLDKVKSSVREVPSRIALNKDLSQLEAQIERVKIGNYTRTTNERPVVRSVKFDSFDCADDTLDDMPSSDNPSRQLFRQPDFLRDEPIFQRHTCHQASPHRPFRRQSNSENGNRFRREQATCHTNCSCHQGSPHGHSFMHGLKSQFQRPSPPQISPQNSHQFSPQLQRQDSHQISPQNSHQFSPQNSHQFSPQLQRQDSHQISPQNSHQFSPQLQRQNSHQISPHFQRQNSHQLSPQFQRQRSHQLSPSNSPNLQRQLFIHDDEEDTEEEGDRTKSPARQRTQSDESTGSDNLRPNKKSKKK
eukprot:TRINITY_DN1588_c0_g1_i1.p1 TRINITY_DN1588_c0_g1~~TRINITY_DN1588_c0_g1_i1.p1  ORF type:complete len:466 (+),score=76.20 TRINITY_DN1588_c0_g1_i1:433-1830(+)